MSARMPDGGQGGGGLGPVLAAAPPTPRQALARLAWKVAILAAAAAAFAVEAPRPLLQFCTLLEALAYAGGMITMAIAALTRQQPLASRLTRWDEALAFGLVSLAAHLCRSWLI